MRPKLDPIAALAKVPASEVKKRGWRGVMRTMGPKGMLVVTNHDVPEAVILSPQEYDRIVRVMNQQDAKAESTLEALRRRFDERLSALRAPDAGDRFRSVMDAPARLEGEVTAGSRY